MTRNRNRDRTRISPNHPTMRRAAAEARTLHLIDVDNLLGDPHTTDIGRIDLVFRTYRRVAGFADDDHAVVATGRNGAHVLAVELAWPSVCHRRRSGADGADLELIEAAEWAVLTRRFPRVVVGSGDRIFVPVVEALQDVGVHVDVVSRPRGLARALADRVRGCVRYLPELAGECGAMAVPA